MLWRLRGCTVPLTSDQPETPQKELRTPRRHSSVFGGADRPCGGTSRCRSDSLTPSPTPGSFATCVPPFPSPHCRPIRSRRSSTRPRPNLVLMPHPWTMRSGARPADGPASNRHWSMAGSKAREAHEDHDCTPEACLLQAASVAEHRHASALVGLASSRFAAGQSSVGHALLEEAVRVVLTWPRHDRARIPLLLRIAETLLGAGHEFQAADVITCVLSRECLLDPSVQVRMGDLLLQAGDVDAAVGQFECARDNAPWLFEDRSHIREVLEHQ